MAWSPLAIQPPTSNSAALSGNLTMLTVDPWTHGIAAGDGSNTNLSFPNAVEALVKKLTGLSGAGLAIAVAASSPAGLAAELNTLSGAFPMPNLERLARRAAKMAALELSKYVLATPMGEALSVGINALPPIRALQRSDLIQAAVEAAEAFKSTNANSNLTAFASEVAAFADIVADIQSEATAGLTGGTGWRFYAANNVASSIQTGHPGHEYPFTSIMLFLGSAGDLGILNEIFQEAP